jgi:2-polyprenyl-6-hydroxyphenyl methylase/3-demethylubiquinone-9 3-methyltransferase
VAKKYDVTRSVHYEVADAFHLPYADNSFDVITAMDFLEHIEDPELVIMEFSRVLKNGGIFFFHTFNRNPISHLFAIKFVEWFIKNTPKDMHMIKYFIKPKELEIYCSKGGLKVMSIIGIRPLLTSIDWEMVKTGIVSKKMKFTLTTSKIISYMGLAVKKGE